MTIEKEGFSIEHIPDNDAAYFSLIEGIVDSIDQFSVMHVRRSLSGYNFRISPSAPKLIPLIMTKLIEMNKYMGIMLNFSKSIKNSCLIQFQIVFLQ